MKRIINQLVKLAKIFILLAELHIFQIGETGCQLETIRVEVNLDKLLGKALGEELEEILGKTTLVLHLLSLM